MRALGASVLRPYTTVVGAQIEVTVAGVGSIRTTRGNRGAGDNCPERSWGQEIDAHDSWRAEWAAGSYGQCATIGIGIESNGIHGADRFHRLITDYAGIASCPLFDLAGYCGIVRHRCERAVA